MRYSSLVVIFLSLLTAGNIYAASFTDNGDGTVTHNDTGLVWQKDDDGTTRTWEAALTYCEGLSLAGSTDWRLPNIKELESITEDTAYRPAINTVYFPKTQLSPYWSSTSIAVISSSAWDVDFVTGYIHYYDYKTDTYYVRCVRGGQ